MARRPAAAVVVAAAPVTPDAVLGMPDMESEGAGELVELPQAVSVSVARVATAATASRAFPEVDLFMLCSSFWFI
ncbi:hypothetical protein Back2_11430 [Nocardioides baekrokdamisoli]|uniref:Uncharacterized protein n=1 Tax=Nocardioides baekrokdamisoli TaxID=1804624 RepID=A0A3G9IES4_9ACTN|nr:hypothetical protein Back2_11430 [Nocardioides baekrokdamisoli]